MEATWKKMVRKMFVNEGEVVMSLFVWFFLTWTLRKRTETHI